jgi:hypothetical protein
MVAAHDGRRDRPLLEVTSMDDKTPTPRPRGHKAAAIALALVATLVAIGIYNAFSPSGDRVRDCIARNDTHGCNLPGPATGAIVLVLLGGWGAAARAWRND